MVNPKPIIAQDRAESRRIAQYSRHVRPSCSRMRPDAPSRAQQVTVSRFFGLNPREMQENHACVAIATPQVSPKYPASTPQVAAAGIPSNSQPSLVTDQPRRRPGNLVTDQPQPKRAGKGAA